MLGVLKPPVLLRLQELCQQLHSKWQVTHVAMAHRAGVVEVCEASVIIAVSSPHRKASLEVSSWLAD
jgi:molybdopterin synthase catalytic subunit